MRRELDRTDGRILSLLKDRMRVAARVKRAKRQLGVGIYDPRREQILLRRLTRKGSRELPPARIRAIFGEILSASRSVGGAIRIAYPRPELSDSHWVGVSTFGSSASFLACTGKTGVYRALTGGKADYGVVPLRPDASPLRRKGIKTLKRVTWNDRGQRTSFLIIGRDHPARPASRDRK